jgi:hypothetical protein
MQQGAVSLRSAIMQPGEVPAPVRFLGKLVLEVLPAAFASVIGAFLFAHYQFGEPDASRPAAMPAAEAVPASAEMMQLVRQEHAMIRDFLTAEQAAEEKRVAAADAADANAAADAKVATAARQAILAEIAEKPAAKRGKGSVIAKAVTGGSSVPTAELPPVVIAGAQQDPVLTPAPPAPPAGASFVSRTLAVPGQVMAVTLHAVMAIGGVPSWIGHHVGATELDTDASPPGAAS